MNEIQRRILELKKERNAIILAHNYQIPEIQQVADYVEDSLGLSQKAAKHEAEVIVFCGVDFMAESAAILCPDKKVLVPELKARCPMAAMVTPLELKKEKKMLKDAAVVCYVNTSAAVKAESDVCCTSANVVKVVNSIHEKKILFIPDRYLAAYVASKTAKQIIPWQGYCPTHEQLTLADLLWAKEEHPDAEVLVHPECRPDVIANADFVYSTGGMVRHARKSSAREFIIGTEVGLIYRLRQENPEKYFYPVSEEAVCPNMKLNTLEKLLRCLENMEFEVKVPENIRVRAKQALDRMLEIGRED